MIIKLFTLTHLLHLTMTSSSAKRGETIHQRLHIPVWTAQKSTRTCISDFLTSSTTLTHIIAREPSNLFHLNLSLIYHYPTQEPQPQIRQDCDAARRMIHQEHFPDSTALRTRSSIRRRERNSSNHEQLRALLLHPSRTETTEYQRQ